MKNLYFLMLFCLISLTIFSQPKTFKNKHKKSAGTTTVTLQTTTVTGNNQFKSLISTPYQAINFHKPILSKKGGPTSLFLPSNTLPIYFERKSSALKSASILSVEEKFYNFFEATKEKTSLKDPRNDLKINEVQQDDLGMTHYKSVQLYRGVEIYGSESTLHIDAKSERFTGRLKNIKNPINTTPELSSEEALSNVVESLKKTTVYEDLSETAKEILNYNSPKIKLIIFEDGANFKLAYEVEVRPNFIELWKYFVDAQTGEVLRMINETNTDGPTTAQAYDLNFVLRNLNTYLENGNYFLSDMAEPMYNSTTGEGGIVTFNANYTSTRNLDYSYISSENNIWDNPTAVSAHANSMATYKYYYENFGRNSINNQGGNIFSFINVTNSDGNNFDNAFWNGEAAFYGNGLNKFTPLAGALDVVAHELTHGVISNSAKLEYYSQSGAINEAYADIFGAMVDRDNWLIGEAISKSGKPMRNLQDPANGGTQLGDGWLPKHMSEMVTGSELDMYVNRDQEGVHINCTIGSHAYYLYATTVSKDKAEQVFYRALVYYLNKNSQFIDFRIAVIQSAKDLYGDNSTEVIEAAKAFDGVGIYGEDPVVDDPEYEVNDGQDYLMSYDTDTENSNTLYRCSTVGEDFIPYTQTDMKGKVSVSDDGSFAVFAGTDDYLKYIYLDPENIEEGNLSEDAFWDNVAVSKDGNRVAAISTEIDTAIYVFDLISGTGVKFILYNPTTSHENVDAGGVLYADIIEFDVSGQYLIYDAYNELTSTTSEEISYWDIGFIHVWDNKANDYGTGHIEKLFNSLPEGVSIGNPVFSKNSANIIAFDYFDVEADVFTIMGADINTGDLDVIFENSILGYPSFSKLDDKIAFSAISKSDVEVVGIVKLAENKISATGEDATLLINNAKWPVFYSTGKRDLGLEPVANFTADYLSGNSPFYVKFIDLSANTPNSWSWSFEGGSPSVSTEQNPIITYSNKGIYAVSLVVQNDYGSNTLNKTSYIEVDQQTSNEQVAHELISFYPNPIEGVLTIQCKEIFLARLIDINGKVCLISDNEKSIDVYELAKGMYFLELIVNDQIVRHKLIKL